ncbi:class I adenylate-forming enzyme family protein [Mycobacterium avium]|uniref:class I adenylate-forming enzyme family protein n=1 Tax=Mycobacterium avium TaxID=1764 RepID=UPI0009C0230C|nr:class I adenylate-forming enzyme family protein [Mycobacterium avium]
MTGDWPSTSLLDPEVLVDPTRRIEILNLTAAESLLLGADRGGELMLVGEGERSVRQMVDQAMARAKGMVAEGLEPGERIMLCLPSSTELIVWAWAVVLAGGSLVMVSARNTEYEVKRSASIADARWVITTKTGDDWLTPEEAQRKFHTSKPVEVPTSQPDWESACFATSGTTGTAKLARFDNRLFSAQAISYQHVIAGGMDDVIVFPQPLVHIAFVAQVHFPLVQGRRLIVVPEFHAQTVVDVAADCKATVISAVPTMWRLLLDRTDFGRRRLPLRRCTYAAAPMPAQLAREMIETAKCEIVHAYGLTEAGGVMTMLGPAKAVNKAGSAGSLLAPQEEMIICDPRTGIRLDHGVTGEVCLRGPAATLGYIGQTEATNQLWQGDLLHTGDLGYIDSDGDLWISGRLKDQINRGGLKIGAREVESVIEDIDGVTGVGVVGVPDPVLGERVNAVVEADTAKLKPDMVRSFAAGRLSDYKVPDRVVVVPELPRNAMGKVDKQALRRILRSDHAPQSG